MNSLMVRPGADLPITTEELRKFIIIGKEKLKAHRAKIRAIEKVGTAHAAKEAALSDAQDVADIVLDAEVRLGQILETTVTHGGSFRGSRGGTSKPLPPDISKKESHYAQTIAKNQTVVEEVKARARKQERIPTSQEVYREIKKRERNEHQASLHSPELPSGKFSVLYADPPWSYDNVGFDQSAASQYATMSQQELCELPIKDLCAETAVLFLWATSPLLPEALEVMGAWGFKYKASMVWVKDKGPGIGWFVYTRHEILLIGTKGETFHPLQKPISCINAKVGKHSSKPNEFYGIIETMYEGKKIELFSRNKREGWESWGNEV